MDECGFRTPGGPCQLPPAHDGPHRSPWIPLGFWAIPGEMLMEMLRQVAAGDDPDVVYAEYYACSEHDRA